MNVTKCVDFSKVYNRTTFGRPMTPGSWVTLNRDIKYTPVTRLSMSCGGGMGGSHWYEYIERVPLEDLVNQNRIIATTWDGKRKLINMNNVVSADEYTIASAVYHSDNPNFPVGEYLVARLIPDGAKVRLVEEFQSD